MGLFEWLAPGVVRVGWLLAFFARTAVLVGCFFGTNAFASFSATPDPAVCSAAPCYKYQGLGAYGDGVLSATVEAACQSWLAVGTANSGNNYAYSGVSGLGCFTVVTRKSDGYDYNISGPSGYGLISQVSVAASSPVYSCPNPDTDPSHATLLSGSTCTCAAGFMDNAAKTACTPAGAIVDILHATKVSSCPWCKGNPIYPLIGSKVEPVVTGMSVGGQPLVFTYDSAKQAAAIAAGKTAKTFGSMPALGGLWESSLHRNLVMGAGGFAATLYRGDGHTISFRYSGSAYIADADVNGTFTAISGGYRYVDAKSSSIETYNTAGQLTGWADTVGNTLTFSYGSAAGYLQKVTDNNGRSLNFAYTLPADGAAADGLISSVRDSLGRTISTGFDTHGNLTQLTWPDTKVRQFVYENASLPWALTGVIDEQGIRYSTFTYDTAGRALSTEHAGGVDKYSVSYGAPPQVTVTQTYDPATQLTTRTHDWQAPAGVQLTQPNGDATNASTSTVLGYPLPTGFSQPAGSGYGASNNASTFDASGNLTSTDDFSGQRSCYTYDSSNRETVRVEGLATTIACTSVLPSGSILPAGSRRIETTWHTDWRLSTKVSQPLLVSTTVYHGQPDPFKSGALANCTSAPALPNGKVIPLVCKQVMQATLANGTPDPATPARATAFSYGATGRLLSSTDVSSYYSDASAGSGDPSFDKVSLLLHGDGANGSTAIADSSPNLKIVTVAGGAAIGTTQSKFGGSSLYFDGVDASNTAITLADSPDFHFPGAYTIEFWVRPSSFKPINTWLYLQSDQVGKPAPVRLEIAPSTGLINVLGSSDNTNWLFASGLSSTSALQLGTWSHVALADDGITARLFVNGVLQASRSTWPKTDSPDPVRIGGAYTGGDREFNGYMDDIRVTKGLARYTANFTPPTQAFENTGLVVDPSATGHTAGDLKSITTPVGHVTQFPLYDGMGRVRQMVDPNGVVTDTVYTPRGWTSSVTVTPPGGAARTTSYTYDNAGQMTGATLPNGTTLGYSYDVAHRLTGVTDAKGNSVTYTLDNAGNKTGEQVKDPSGNLQRNITRVYDALNRVQQVTGASN